MAINGFGKPSVDAAAVLDVPALDNAKADVASCAESSPDFSRDVIVVDDRGFGIAYAARGFDMLKVLGVGKSVLALNPRPGLVARIAQSHSVFRHIWMVLAASLSVFKSVEAKA